MVATDAVEGRLPPLAFKPAVIAAVVVQPEPEEEQAHERAEDDRAGGEIEHAPSKRSLAGAVKSQPKGSRGTTKNTKAEWGVNREAGAKDREWKAVGISVEMRDAPALRFGLDAT
jgi:hypothetical protein